jgi:hypothetical protein
VGAPRAALEIQHSGDYGSHHTRMGVTAGLSADEIAALVRISATDANWFSQEDDGDYGLATTIAGELVRSGRLVTGRLTEGLNGPPELTLFLSNHGLSIRSG